MKLGIVMLYVQDIAQSARFYQERAGFHVIDELSDKHFMALAAGGSTLLGLEAMEAVEEKHRKPSGGFELGIEVEDIEAVYQVWQASGVEVITGIEPMPGGRSFLAKDPDGHTLSVFGMNS